MADMKRRDFISFVGGAAATAWPLAARAQQAKRMPKVGILLFAQADLAVIDPFVRGLEALGYVDGKTVSLEYRDAGGNYERLPRLADELVRLNPDAPPETSDERMAYLPTPDRVYFLGGLDEQPPVVRLRQEVRLGRAVAKPWVIVCHLTEPQRLRLAELRR